MILFFFFFIFSYAAKARITSDRYKDQIKTPTEIAVHWVKHVARNKGAPHLRSAAVDLPFYVYYNLDVYFVILAIIGLLIAGMKKLISGTKSNATKGKRKTQ